MTTEPVTSNSTTEVAEATQAPGPTPHAGKFRARLIEGDRWGSSGYYPRKVIERDGPKVWPAGTAIYLDHPGVEESYDRPERSVRDLAGKITSTPAYEGDGLYADVQFYPHVAPLVEAMWEDVGMSIRASATVEAGERDGRKGPIIQTLENGLSVDVVTKAGAGGKLVALLESARESARIITETNPTHVEVQQESPSQGANHKEEPVADTTTNPPAPVTEATTEHVTESARITELEEAVQAHRAEVTEANNRVKAANSLAAELIVAEAFQGIEAPRAVARIVEAAVTEAGAEALDADALRETAVAEAAEYRGAHGAGTPSGLGGSVELAESASTIDPADYQAQVLTALHGGN